MDRAGALTANTRNDLFARQATYRLQIREAARLSFIHYVNSIFVIHISPCQPIEAGLYKRYSLVSYAGE
jgi:hypothetical protein